MEITQSEYFVSLSNEYAYEKAAALGQAVIIPDDYTLTLDFDDTLHPPESYTIARDLLETFYRIEEETHKPSKNGGIHVYLKMERPFSVTERIALQAALGSDPKREILSLIRAKEQIGHPVMMFERPDGGRVDVGAGERETQADFADVLDLAVKG